MAWTPDKVAALLGSRDGDVGERTAQLREVVAGIRGESEVGDGGRLAAIAEKLADGARDRKFTFQLA